jgi:hypothetical protein
MKLFLRNIPEKQNHSSSTHSFARCRHQYKTHTHYNRSDGFMLFIAGPDAFYAAKWF